MKSKNVIQDKSFEFALRIVNLFRYLIKQNEFILSKQILRSGTSIAANVEEAIGSSSRKDFLAKFTIVYKEARETYFWLKLLKESKIIDENQSNSMMKDCDQLLRIIGSIQKTLKANIRNP